jgi:hypothetical protein
MDLLKGASTAEDIIERCVQEAMRLKLDIRHKRSRSLKWSKFTATYYREIRLGSNFTKLPKWAQATIWAHEMVHVYQWRDVGRSKFGTSYVFNPMKRWEWEMQGYRMSVAIRKRLGISTETNERYIEDKIKSVWKAYVLSALHKPSYEKKTRMALTTAL